MYTQSQSEYFLFSDLLAAYSNFRLLLACLFVASFRSFFFFFCCSASTFTPMQSINFMNIYSRILHRSLSAFFALFSSSNARFMTMGLMLYSSSVAGCTHMATQQLFIKMKKKKMVLQPNSGRTKCILFAEVISLHFYDFTFQEGKNKSCRRIEWMNGEKSVFHEMRE